MRDELPYSYGPAFLWGMIFFAVVGALISLCQGCATIDIQRKLYDDRGRELGTLTVRHPAATADGAARLMDKARDFQVVTQAGDAERRAAETARASVDKGEPTVVNTVGGQVQSGYVGYGGPYGALYDPYGYGYGRMLEAMYYPGADPNMVRVEAWSRQGGYRTLPPLGEPVTPYAPHATGQPGAAPAAADPALMGLLRGDVNELLRIHRPKRK